MENKSGITPTLAISCEDFEKIKNSIEEKDKEIKRLHEELGIRIQNSQNLVRKYDELEEIIIELERCFEKTWQDYKDSESESLYAIAIENKSYFDKLQELKGSDENEQEHDS